MNTLAWIVLSTLASGVLSVLAAGLFLAVPGRQREAALPHLDAFAPAHNLESLERLARIVVS